MLEGLCEVNMNIGSPFGPLTNVLHVYASVSDATNPVDYTTKVAAALNTSSQLEAKFAGLYSSGASMQSMVVKPIGGFAPPVAIFGPSLNQGVGLRTGGEGSYTEPPNLAAGIDYRCLPPKRSGRSFVGLLLSGDFEGGVITDANGLMTAIGAWGTYCVSPHTVSTCTFQFAIRHKDGFNSGYQYPYTIQANQTAFQQGNRRYPAFV